MKIQGFCWEIVGKYCPNDVDSAEWFDECVRIGKIEKLGIISGKDVYSYEVDENGT